MRIPKKDTATTTSRMEKAKHLEDIPVLEFIELDETDSTNNFLRGHVSEEGKTITLATAEYQKA